MFFCPRSDHYPDFLQEDASGANNGDEKPLVRIADVGCGFGGLLVSLSPLYPQTLMVGMELRDKVIHLLSFNKPVPHANGVNEAECIGHSASLLVYSYYGWNGDVCFSTWGPIVALCVMHRVCAW